MKVSNQGHEILQKQHDLISGFVASESKKIQMLTIVVVLLAISLVLDVSIGPGNFSFSTVLDVLMNRESHGIKLEVIIWDYRLPIAVTAVIVGAMLGISGALMQTLLNNPLAEPFTLGVSSAASFGAALAIVTGIGFVANVGSLLVTLNAFIFALVTCGLLLLLMRIKGVGTQAIILFGIAIFFAFNAMLAMMEYGASETQLQRIVFWMLGSLNRASWMQIFWGTSLLAIIMPFCMMRTWRLTALRLGEESALSMGVDLARLRIEILICISLLAATAVAFVGTIGFVGLVGPHIARLLVGENQRYFIPLSALLGALMLSVTSIVSKALTPGIIYPIGIITALIGVPVFLAIIIRHSKEQNL
ncbi:iron ABC transporter permease [Marinomonas sp. 15G1-11]|uniref:Iron ABC transporter permease n=1 Tax=Marinomonas phaeophyticola TaxID=3004091 RepID=A0ABT4JQX5_9GAMM|nr:iron ABC transporter permease [Marinomonas sp. 15G1-11]MCZ2720748.1 iron ABC transporter permease [Marinomonas sp. 15G1-11]